MSSRFELIESSITTEIFHSERAIAEAVERRDNLQAGLADVAGVIEELTLRGVRELAVADRTRLIEAHERAAKLLRLFGEAQSVIDRESDGVDVLSSLLHEVQADGYDAESDHRFDYLFGV